MRVFITFIKSRVCSTLWSQRRQELKYLTFPLVEVQVSNTLDDAPTGLNSLTAALYNAATDSESMEDSVIEEIHVQQFRERLPLMLQRLSDQERKAVRLNTFMITPVLGSLKPSVFLKAESAKSLKQHSRNSKTHTSVSKTARLPKADAQTRTSIMATEKRYLNGVVIIEPMAESSETASVSYRKPFYQRSRRSINPVSSSTLSTHIA